MTRRILVGIRSILACLMIGWFVVAVIVAFVRRFEEAAALGGIEGREHAIETVPFGLLLIGLLGGYILFEIWLQRMARRFPGAKNSPQRDTR